MIAVKSSRVGEVVARGEIAFEVAPATGRGFVRVEPKSRRYFVFDDGTPLFLNGLCCCFLSGFRGLGSRFSCGACSLFRGFCHSLFRRIG